MGTRVKSKIQIQVDNTTTDKPFTCSALDAFLEMRFVEEIDNNSYLCQLNF